MLGISRCWHLLQVLHRMVVPLADAYCFYCLAPLNYISLTIDQVVRVALSFVSKKTRLVNLWDHCKTGKFFAFSLSYCFAMADSSKE